MLKPIYGHYLDGKTSKRWPARLEVSSFENKSISINLDTVENPKADTGSDGQDNSFSLKFCDINIASRLGNTPREMELPQAQLFISDDNEGIDTLISKLGDNQTASLLHRLESSLPLIVFSVVFTLLFIWATVSYGIPKAAEIIAYQMPSFANEKLGNSLSILDKTMFEPSELEQTRQQHIQLLLQPYIDTHYAQDPDTKPQLIFRSGMSANAFALPGGEIVFTDEFVDLAEKDEELIAVFFHELGHLKHKHITRRVLQDGMVTLLVIMMSGDIDSVDLLTGLPTLMLDLSYSREFETEADLHALSQMQKNGIPLEHFSQIMLRLQHENAGPAIGEDMVTSEDSQQTFDWNMPDFLSTHPSTDDRVDLVRKFKRQQNLQ